MATKTTTTSGRNFVFAILFAAVVQMISLLSNVDDGYDQFDTNGAKNNRFSIGKFSISLARYLDDCSIAVQLLQKIGGVFN
jgi:hypothetical protein